LGFLHDPPLLVDHTINIYQLYLTAEVDSYLWVSADPYKER
jgi:hypothetical protein